jgi:3-hydroxyisobutyrate dehydrogenase
MKQKIGFIGLGMMGYPMARKLCDSGYELIVSDVAIAASEKFCAENKTASIARRPADFAGAGIVITMLPNSDIVDSVVLGAGGQEGLISLLGAGSVIIDMSSSEPTRTRVLAEKLADRKIDLLDAPVSGGVRKAEDGTLAIMVGGDAAVFAKYSDLLHGMGKAVTHVGPSGAGHALKALNNYVSAAGLVAAAEALVVGQAFGLDPAVMTDMINGSTGKNNTTENKVKQFMLSGKFNAGFSMRLMDKDLSTALKLGQVVGKSMVLGACVGQLWHQAVEELPEKADHTEMYRYLSTK